SPRCRRRASPTCGGTTSASCLTVCAASSRAPGRRDEPDHREPREERSRRRDAIYAHHDRRERQQRRHADIPRMRVGSRALLRSQHPDADRDRVARENRDVEEKQRERLRLGARVEEVARAAKREGGDRDERHPGDEHPAAAAMGASALPGGERDEHREERGGAAGDVQVENHLQHAADSARHEAAAHVPQVTAAMHDFRHTLARPPTTYNARMKPTDWLTAAGLVTWVASGVPSALAVAGGRLTGAGAIAWLVAFAA